MQSLQGQLLVAAVRLTDPNFRRAVVLMIQHSAEGALGLILNRPTKARIRDIWSQISDEPCDSKALIHLGGPVEGPLMALHRSLPAADDEVVDGVFFTPESAKIQQLVSQEASPIKFFVGYSGWGAGQLEAEMEEGSWLVMPARWEHVFEPDDDLWDKIFRQISGSSLVKALGIKHVPPDPRLN